MELYQLKTFIKVADTGNLTRASEALFTSQPAVSAQVKALEDELGIQLFSRTSKGMLLSAAGKQLYAQAQHTLDAAEMLQQQAQSLRNETVGEVRIGVHTDYKFMLTGKIFNALSEQHPRITLHFLSSSSATVVQQIRLGELDAGFMFGPCNAADMSLVALSEVPLRIVAPADWQQDFVDAELDNLMAFPWVYTSKDCPFYHLFEQVMAQTTQQPSKLVWANNEDAVRELVKAKAGLALLRLDDAKRLQTSGDVCIWRGGLPLSISLSFITLKRRQHEAAIRAFSDCVTENWNLPPVCQQSQAG